MRSAWRPWSPTLDAPSPTDGHLMSLKKFIVDNRRELIERTRAKVATRRFPQLSDAEMEHGVPAFLSQLGTVLCAEEERDPAQKVESGAFANAHIVRSATLHGQDLSKFGFTIEQVVRGYGDVCQAVTELAGQQGAVLTIAEFHTLNRCLDNAIAGALTSWDEERNKALAEAERRLDLIRRELSSLVGSATDSFDALSAARGGGAAAAFQDFLAKIRSILNNSNGVAHERNTNNELLAGGALTRLGIPSAAPASPGDLRSVGGE